MKVKFYATLLLCVGVLMLANRGLAQMKPETMRQIQSLLDEKASRTPAQRKVGSQLLQAARESHGQKMAPNTNLDAVDLLDEDGKVKVDINLTQLTDAFISKIQSLGGNVIYPSKKFNTVRAALPLDAIEKLAADGSVKFIEKAAAYLLSGTGDSKQKSDKTSVNKTRTVQLSDVKKAVPSLVRRRPTIAERQAYIKQKVEKYMMMLGTGSVNSQGDHSHRADDARNTFGYAGQGIKIGVLSDSYNALGVANADVLTGDLPGTGNPYGNTTPVTVVADYSGGADEGRAMLQIVHDLVPKAQLFFATADLSEASFAANIVALRTTYNCDIIIDDVYYFDEPAFQDGIVAQAVNTVTAAGAMYFSSAGNSGSLSLGTGGVWEGDFTDVGSPVFTGSAKTGTIHNFGSPIAGDSILTVASGAYNLQWSDPWGASTNDYDLFLVSAAGVVKASSTTTQSGLQNPYESFAPPALVAGDRLIVFKAATAAVRAISLNTNRGTLRKATSGQTHGHACAADAFCVAATPATGAPFLSTQGVESFTSDGLRKIFFNPDGTPITPNNFLFGTNGGIVRNKPDITAADGVSTTLGSASGLNPFYGTSAAAPHAGAIAALLKSAGPTLTNTQIRTILTSTALDILTPSYDLVSGFGIVQAYQGVQAINPVPLPYVNIGTTTITEGSFSNGNGSLDPGETGNLLVQLKNQSLVSDPNVVATVTTTTPGVTITQGTVNYGNIASGTNATNTGTPFTFAVNSSVACGTVILFNVKVTFTGGVGSVGYTTSYTLGLTVLANISSTLGTTPPASSGYTAVTGTFNTARLNRNTPVSSCGSQKATPILTSTVGVRAYDAYTFPSSNTANQCVTVTMTAPNGINLYLVAYNSNGFVPTNPAANFLADQGSSAATQSFSFTDTAGKPFTLVVYNITPGSDVGSAYTITASYTSCTAPKACTPITITKNSLPAGATGTYYVQHITATGGSGAYSDTLTGALPAGMAFAGDSLYGTPTQAGTFPITVKVADLAGCSPVSMSYNLVITGILPAAVTATAGTPQSATIAAGSTFATTLQATVKDASSNPLPGVNVIFTAPSAGASGTFTGGLLTATVVTNASGVATAPTFSPNSISGTYTVTATVVGLIDTAKFILTNNCVSTIVTTNADSGPGSLRYIVANACASSVVTFDPSVTSIVLTSGEIAITKATTISGNGANALTISGNFNSRIFNISAGTATVSISGMTLRDGKLPTTASTGGGAIFINNGASAGIVNITGCYITNNDVTTSTGFLGGGVDNEGGVVTIDKCTITNNKSLYRAGAVESEGFGSMTITNSTITGNTASATGLGGAIRSFLPLKIINSTIYANSASGGANISIGGGTDTIMNSIVAGGTILVSGGAGPDVAGALYSGDYNLIGSISGATVTGSTTHNIVGANPKLLPVANYGGTMPTLLPMSSSPVVDAGNPVLLATATDERGFTRKVGTSADIGAVETNYAATIAAGTPQTTAVGTAFPIALAATVTESGNLIAGDSITFGAPASGASGTFTGGLKVVGVFTNASGVATAPTFTANGTVGTYNDTASIGSAFTPLKYVLTNKIATVPFAGCPNINLIVTRPGYNVYNNEPLSIYTLDTATGAATLIPGGPLKDFSLNKNIDLNGASVNGQDNFLYGIRDTINAAGTAQAAMFYRVGNGYGNDLLGVLPAPALLSGENLSVVNPSAGSFDDQGNYYYIGMAGAYSFTTKTFTPSSYYVGKLANVASLASGTGTLAPTWVKIDFTNAPAGYKASLISPISSASGTGAGTSFQDLAYSNLYKSLYVYAAYSNGGTYTGQLFGINPTTGVATFYSNPPTFGAVNNEVAGISTTASGNLRVFMTSGDIYKPVMNQAGTDFTSTLVKVGASGVASLGAPGSIRGDLASCGVGATTLPVTRLFLPGSITIGLPNQIVAYPNPAQSLTTIAVGQPLTNATVRLYGAAGNLISEKSGVSGLTFQMDMTGKAGGMYTIEVIQGGNTQVVKIVH